MAEFFSSPLFGITLTLATYCIGLILARKIKNPLANPLLFAVFAIICILKAFDIPLEAYNKGGDMISMLLAPSMAALGYSIYLKWEVLKRQLVPIVAGCAVGAVTSMGSVYLLCRAFGIEEQITRSMLPKSVTTPIAMEVSQGLGGITSITVAAVVLTGIMGAVLAPTLVKVFRVKNQVAAGAAIGSCSHALGTSKALELGETQGAVSGVAIGLSGIITVIIALFI